MATQLNDIEFMNRMRSGLAAKRDRRARRLLALYIGKRSPAMKQLDAYSVMCECVDIIDEDIRREIEAQAMAASM